MYTKRIRLLHYGPLRDVDISLPFSGSQPKPVVFVGANSSGKSLLLSHVVNGLVAAKDSVFPDSREVADNKVYKIRSPVYISGDLSFYYARVDFIDDLHISELLLRKHKSSYEDLPRGLEDPHIMALWERLADDESSMFDTNLTLPRHGFTTEQQISDLEKVTRLVQNNCLLYFPSNRFEEPAWLNEGNLTRVARPEMIEHMSGQTDRRLVNVDPLRNNQDWLFDLLFDRAVLEARAELVLSSESRMVPAIVHAGPSARTYDIVLRLLRQIVNQERARLTLGPRHHRLLGIAVGDTALVQNIFQSSSGEVSLLNLFVSILRDAELSSIRYVSTSDISGVVIVDEIDLHLHAKHQYEILPKLLRMFPNIQFIVTTHAPLFVLGMRNEFGDAGFALYRLPDGRQISPEEFNEFGDAYAAFRQTQQYTTDIKRIVDDAGRPVLLVEGETDRRYLQRAAVLCDREDLLDLWDIRDTGGESKLAKLWKGFTEETVAVLRYRVLLLFDCDVKVESGERGELFRRRVPIVAANPIKKGVENLFGVSILERARRAKPAFIDVIAEHYATMRGVRETVPESWLVNESEKTNLCDWICANGTPEDFECFETVFALLDEVVGEGPSEDRQ